MKQLAALLAGIAFATQPLVALAQVPEPALYDAPVPAPVDAEKGLPEALPEALGAPISDAPANTVNCFDYYSFGSVQVDVTPSVASAVSGVPITFNGTIKNANPYPVVDGAVYVKIFRQRGSGGKDVNGPDVVDQFYAAEGLTIPANGQMPISIDWNIPAYAVSGEYKVATFFSVSHKFNLLGLPFTDDVVGNTASFKVVGELEKGVSFKKDAVTVNGDPFYFAAFPPRVDESAPVTVKAVLMNPTGKSVTIPVQWTLYHWSQNDQSNFITSKEEQVTIAAGKSTEVTFVVEDATHPVYVLQGVAKWEDSSSVINVRFVREGKDQLRINYPSVMSYPLRSGEQATVFSCLHNAGSSSMVPNAKLELVLTDKYGRTIHEYTYTGDVSGAMMGVADQFTPSKTYGTFTLQAKLFSGQDLVDMSSVTYECDKLDPTLCTAESGGALDFSTLTNNPIMLGGGIALALILFFILLLVMKMFGGPRGMPPVPPSTPAAPMR